MIVKDPNRRFAAYVLDHPVIDQQHEEIYDLLVAIRDEIPPGKTPALLVQVLRQMITHFKYEEKLMDEIEFDYHENHKVVHQKVCALFAESILFASKEIVDDLINEHLKHIEYHDRILVTWWMTRQRRRSTDPHAI